MNSTNRALLFFVLPVISVLMFPPGTLFSSIPLLLVALLIFCLLGAFLWRHKSLALTLAIFLLGLNGIIRMMLLFSRSVSAAGVIDVPWIITSLLSIILSTWLLIRLDRLDVRSYMYA